MKSLSGLPNVGSLIPSIDSVFINFAEIPSGRQTCDVCGDFFSITGDLQDCPVGLPCRHVHCFGCTWTWLHRKHSCPECDTEYKDIRPICAALQREALLCRQQGIPPLDQSEVKPLFFSSHGAGDFVVGDDDVMVDDSGRPGIKGLSSEGFRSSIGVKAEEVEDSMTLMQLDIEMKDAIPTPSPDFRSGTATSTQEYTAEMLGEQARTNQESQIKRDLRKKNIRETRARLRKMRAEETDSQRAERLRKSREYQREYKANQTAEKRAKRLETARKWRLKRRARESKDEREKRLAKNREWYKARYQTTKENRLMAYEEVEVAKV